MKRIYVQPYEWLQTDAGKDVIDENGYVPAISISE
jgi:hypothetical protein